MTALEIGLLIAGFAMLIGSFFIVDKFSSGELERISKMSSIEIEKITEKEMEKAKERMEETFQECFEEVEERAQREFEKISNEKIMAVSEYSETVLEEINKSHKEVVFLYSMLSDKQDEVKELISNQVRSEKVQAKQAESLIQEIGRQSIESEPEIDMEEEIINYNQRILNLHQDGKSPVEIARELGLGIGEVKLVIDLFKGEK
ncbi:DUF6115 domain-containing protein [Anaerosacchariphilus polymeriproducens]|uniref:Uncharacterized protein n=1 Tax=Anaerosacchariphilus polymeriproducens TaxID=1812858 RepID=A0A371AS56_9FIRM|nr:DUF6115 domain-containing protein [Anaerosacchariphilus polymeriproducens]RDU22403.1 hypothetical protein DWV06_14000 [Anaerosacchariphilus polymeriproducens]